MKQIFLVISIIIGLLGYYFFVSKKSNFLTDAFGINEFKSIIGLQIAAIDQSNIGIGLHLSRFFLGGDINGEVKIKGTNRTLLIQQPHLDAVSLQGRLFVAWVEKTTQGNNILFAGKVLEVQKSLMTELKEILKGTSKEIEQSTIDTQLVSKSLLFSDLSFTFTFYPDDKSYWRPDEFAKKPWARRSIPVDMGLINMGELLTWQEYLTDNANFSDQVIVHLINAPSSNRKNVEMTTEFYQVPKTVIADFKETQKGVKLAVNKNDDWILRVSLTVTLSSPYLRHFKHFKRLKRGMSLKI